MCLFGFLIILFSLFKEISLSEGRDSCTIFPRCFICKWGARQSWMPLARPGVKRANKSLLILSWKQFLYFCLQQQAINLTQSILSVPQRRKGYVLVHTSYGRTETRQQEMQKTSYSTRTRGTIPTTPTVNALVIHRRLQLKDRVRRGLAGLVSWFSLEHYKFTRCSAKDVGEQTVCARTGTCPVCNHKQHASEDLTQPEVSELGHTIRNVQSLT